MRFASFLPLLSLVAGEALPRRDPPTHVIAKRAAPVAGDTLYCSSAFIHYTLNGQNYQTYALGLNGAFCFTSIPTSQADVVANIVPAQYAALVAAIQCDCITTDGSTTINGTAVNAICADAGYGAGTTACAQNYLWATNFQVSSAFTRLS